MTPQKHKILDIIEHNLTEKEVDFKFMHDYGKLHEIYLYYLQGQFFMMAREIKRYDEFEFFKDLMVFLKHNYLNADQRSDTWNNILDIYFKVDDAFNNYLFN